jgi:hypothetical protein
MLCRHDGAGSANTACTKDQESSTYIGGVPTDTDVSNHSSRINDVRLFLVGSVEDRAITVPKEGTKALSALIAFRELMRVLMTQTDALRTKWTVWYSVAISSFANKGLWRTVPIT